MFKLTGMFLNLRNSIPPWKEDFLLIDEADAWKWKDEITASKALYEQWGEVYSLVALYADSLQQKQKEAEDSEEENDDDESGFTARLIHENLMMVAPKIMSAAGDTLYIIKMENASVICFNCRKMMEMVGWAALNGEADPKHKAIIREAMEVFKERFKEWIAFFKPDEIDDDWGLYK